MALHRPFVGSRVLMITAAAALLVIACGDSTSDSDNDTGEGGAGAGNGGDNTGAGAGNGGDSTNTGASSAGGNTTSGPLVGCAATFDGQDDVLLADVGDDAARDNDFSLAVSIRPQPLAEGQVYFVAGRHLDGSSNGYYLALLREGGLKARMIVFTGGATCQATASLADPTGFVHILGAFDSPSVRVFIDGELAIDEPCGDFTSFIEPSSVFSIGRSSGGVFAYGGDIDDVLYLPSAMSAAFDPAELACGTAGVRYHFDGVAPAETSSVMEACGNSVDATVGTASGADAADPTFVCAR